MSQRVAALCMMMSGLKRKLSGRPIEADVESALTFMQQTAVALGDEIRHVSHDLHPTVLQHAGLVRALAVFCSDFETLHTIDISFTAEGDVGDLGWDASLCLYRVTQEALRNVAKHAEAQHVRVELSRGPSSLQLSISDDGKGFDEVKMRGQGHGLGLVSIDERVRMLRGTVQIETRPRGGTRMNVHIPYSDSVRLDDAAVASKATIS